MPIKMPKGFIMTTENNENAKDRRGFLRKAVAGMFGGLFVHKAADAAEGDLETSGQVLKRHVRKGQPPVQPLDTMVLFERGDDSTGRPMTHEVLSLIHEEKGENSYPWTIYASLETHHTGGDACVLCSRLHKHGPGWSTGLHSEVFVHNRAVALGANVEMSNDYTGTEQQQVIGVNIMAALGDRPMQYGIQIHDNQNHFEKAIGLNGKSEVGLDMAGEFDVGLHAHDNNIRLNEGACVELDGEGKIKVRYKEGRIEFLNGEKCFGHLDVNGEDHAL